MNIGPVFQKKVGRVRVVQGVSCCWKLCFSSVGLFCLVEDLQLLDILKPYYKISVEKVIDDTHSSRGCDDVDTEMLARWAPYQL